MADPAVIQGLARAAGNFAEAAPGHRFNLYFPFWRNDWTPDNSRKKDALKACTSIPGPVSDLLDQLRRRQQALFGLYPDALPIPAVSTAPFATGLGNEHPVENGFAFLTPYGLPYLAGSGVKGVLRRAAEDLALCAGEYAITPTPLTVGGGISLLDVWWLFGFEGAAGAVWERGTGHARAFEQSLALLAARPDLPEFIRRAFPTGKERARYLDNPKLFLGELGSRRQEIHTRGALDFWDVFPKPPMTGPNKDSLTVEIMTPHYTDYYQNGASPHDADQPIPIPFLAVPAGSNFDFHVVCHAHYLPEALRQSWQPLLRTVFTHAFDWLGFGAKTAVGYGQMEVAQPRKDRSAAQTTQKHPQGGGSQSPEVSRSQVRWPNARLSWSKGNQTLTVYFEGKKAEARQQQARALLEKLPEDARKRLEKGKEVSMDAQIELYGRQLTIIGLYIPER